MGQWINDPGRPKNVSVKRANKTGRMKMIRSPIMAASITKLVRSKEHHPTRSVGGVKIENSGHINNTSVVKQ